MLETFMERNAVYWRTYYLDAAPLGPPILVDMMHFNLEYVACGLSAGASLRTAANRPLVGLVGRAGILDPISPPLEMDATLRLGRSFGVERFIDVHEQILAAPQAGDWLNPIRVLARRGPEAQRLSMTDLDAIKAFRDPDGFALGRFIMDTAIRGARVPTLQYGAQLSRWVEYMGCAREWVKALFDASPYTAVSVGHTDYCPYGFIAEYGLSRGTPALLWTGSDRSAFLVTHLEEGQSLIGACRAANRDAFKADQAASNGCATPEVAALNRLVHASSLETGRIGLAGALMSGQVVTDLRHELFSDDTRPIVCLFAHTYSDVPCQDEALFRDHLEWIETTLDYAARNPTFNLLIKIHPQDAAYDLTNVTESLERRFESNSNIAFCRQPIPMDVIAAQSILGLTVRGTPGFLAPTLGLRMVLAGKSVFSDAGMATVPSSVEDYFAEIQKALNAPAMTEAEVAYAKAFLVFHLLTGSRRSALTPLLRGDDQTFFGWATETLRTWVPEDCELSQALRSHWTEAHGFGADAMATRLGARAERHGGSVR